MCDHFPNTSVLVKLNSSGVVYDYPNSNCPTIENDGLGFGVYRAGFNL